MSNEPMSVWFWSRGPAGPGGTPGVSGPSERCHHGSRHGSAGGWGGPPWGGAGFGGPGGPGPWGRGPRARRGDVRIAILALLAEKPMHGYQIIQELSDRSGGAWRPSPGSIYPTLQLLEDEGLVSAKEIDGKRVFDVTDEGRKTVADRKDGGAMPWDQVAADMGEDVAALREVTMQVGAAVWQVGSAGSAEQQKKVITILEDTRKRIYGVLAEGE